MSFNAANYRRMYRDFLGPLAQPITLQVNNGVGFDPVAGFEAHVSKWRESDLVAGGSIQLGDLRLIIPNDINNPVPVLGLKDRIEIDGRSYSIVHWDVHTRSVGDETIAVEATIRG